MFIAQLGQSWGCLPVASRRVSRRCPAARPVPAWSRTRTGIRRQAVRRFARSYQGAPTSRTPGGIRAPLKTATLDPEESCAWSGRYRAELSAQSALPRARRFARPPHPLGAVPPPPLAWGGARCGATRSPTPSNAPTATEPRGRSARSDLRALLLSSAAIIATQSDTGQVGR